VWAAFNSGPVPGATPGAVVDVPFGAATVTPLDAAVVVVLARAAVVFGGTLVLVIAVPAPSACDVAVVDGEFAVLTPS